MAQIARLHAESIAMYLAHCPKKLLDDALAAGMNPRLVAGVRAARDAFVEQVNEVDAQILFDQIKADVEEGLVELEKKGKR